MSVEVNSVMKWQLPLTLLLVLFSSLLLAQIPENIPASDVRVIIDISE